MKNLNELRYKAYQCAVAHGWHEENLSGEHFLCLVISELMEAVEADRKRKYAKVEMFKECQDNSILLPEETWQRKFKEDFETYIKGTVEEELADTCIRLLDYFGVVNFTIDNSYQEDEVIEEFSRIYKDKIFTESIFNIANSITRFETQVALVKVFGLSKFLGIDIFWFIELKMKYNELRPYKYGGKSY